MKIPNFFIIGAPKCGTTALSEYLRDHPRVFLSDPKEPNYLSDDLKLKPYYLETLDDYLKLFAAATDNHLAVGEASVWYLYSASAIKNIYRLNKESKLIVILRNPVDMIYSCHSQLLKTSHENEKDFKKAWQLQTARTSGENLPPSCREPAVLYYGQIAQYSRQVERVFKVFPRDQVNIVLFDDFIASPMDVYEKILLFLKVPSDNRKIFPVVNPNEVVRFMWLERLLAVPPPVLLQLARKLSRISDFKLRKFTRPIRRLNAKVQKRAPMDPALRAELVDYFRDDVKKLSQLINRDLDGWLKPE